ncbi:MAG: hypothetical protein JWM81_4 [Candidatus Saccharibacteria bacterium]|nr:hypothetical protein [Candidatus Saccharibacteria bacterium]
MQLAVEKAAELATKAVTEATINLLPYPDGRNLNDIFGEQSVIVEEFVDMLTNQSKFGGIVINSRLRGYKIGRRVPDPQRTDNKSTRDVYLCSDKTLREHVQDTHTLAGTTRVVQPLQPGLIETGKYEYSGWNEGYVDSDSRTGNGSPIFTFTAYPIEEILLDYAQNALPEYRVEA